MFKSIFWFLGVYSAPVGIAFGLAVQALLNSIEAIKVNDDSIRGLNGGVSFMVIFVSIVSLMIVITLNNCKKKFIDGETEFNPFIQLGIMGPSKDKRKAQNHSIPMKYLSKKPDGFVIGLFKKLFVRIPFNQSPENQLVVGAPGCGKSTCAETPIIYNFNLAGEDKLFRSMLATDVKGELYAKGVFAGRNDVAVLDPSSFKSCGFNIYACLNYEDNDDEIAMVLDAISRTLVLNPGGDNAFFYSSAQKILCAALMYCYRKGLSFPMSIDKVIHVRLEDLIAEILTDPEMKSHPKITGMVKVYDGKDSDAFQDISMTLQEDLAIFDTETVRQFFSEDNPNQVDWSSLSKGISIFLSIPDHLLRMYAPIFRLVIQLCMKYMMSIDELEDRDTRPVWFLIDEAGSIGKIPDLVTEILPRARSKHIQVSLLLQSLAQLEECYGSNDARAIIDCCKTNIVFSCNDTKSAEMYSKWTGTYRETRVSTQQSNVLFDKTVSSTISETDKQVMEVDDIKYLEKNNKVLVFTKDSWFLTDKLPYYKIQNIKEISDKVLEQNKKYKRGNY